MVKKPIIKTESQPSIESNTLADLKTRQEQANKEKRSALMATYRALLSKDVLSNGDSEQLQTLISQLNKSVDDAIADQEVIKKAVKLEQECAGYDELYQKYLAAREAAKQAKKEMEIAQNKSHQTDVEAWHLGNKCDSLSRRQADLNVLKYKNADLFSVQKS